MKQETSESFWITSQNWEKTSHYEESDKVFGNYCGTVTIRSVEKYIYIRDISDSRIELYT